MHTAARAATQKPNHRRLRRAIAATLLLNAVLPAVLFVVLRRWLTDPQALAGAGTLPLLHVLIAVARRRTPDPLGVFVSCTFAAALVVFMLSGGDPLAIQLHEVVPNGLFGLGILLAIACGFRVEQILVELAPPAARNDAQALADAHTSGGMDRRQVRRGTVVVLILSTTLVLHSATIITLALGVTPAQYVLLSRVIGVPLLAAGIGIAFLYGWLTRTPGKTTDGRAGNENTLTDPGWEELRGKYRTERDKRLRPDGTDQYLSLTEHPGISATDPHTRYIDREPRTEHHTVLCVGGGFAGLVTAAQLTEAGVDDVRIVEQGGDFGGTWYWNRYPGAQCDTHSLIYLPLLEETGHMPTEKYVHGPEIRAHCRRIGTRYGLYANALFQTRVTDLAWDEQDSHWRIRTDRGDRLTAQFVVLGIGPLNVPKLPGIPGIDTFRGHAFHTSRWDYAYTGGDADGAPMCGLADKRVAIIGTGATAVQCVPPLARACAELYVFQRTPSSVDVRDNHPLDPNWFAGVRAEPGWQRRWMENFTANQTLAGAAEDLVMDGWTDIARSSAAAIATLPTDHRSPERVQAALEDADFAKMDEIRARVDSVVADEHTAERLKAWYSQLCKRPCFHDEYLQAYNTPGVHLVDTDGRGVEAVTESGVVVDGREYPVDCIVFASGFEVGTPLRRRAGFEIAGRAGETLSAHWAEGMRTLHGTHAHGFPNAFLVQHAQGANLLSNIPHNIVEAAATVAAVVAQARENRHRSVEVTAAAEQAWVDLLMSGKGNSLSNADCTPGYYNNEGHTQDRGAQLTIGHPDGPLAYFHYLQRWRAAKTFDGLTFD